MKADEEKMLVILTVGLGDWVADPSPPSRPRVEAGHGVPLPHPACWAGVASLTCASAWWAAAAFLSRTRLVGRRRRPGPAPGVAAPPGGGRTRGTSAAAGAGLTPQ